MEDIDSDVCDGGIDRKQPNKVRHPEGRKQASVFISWRVALRDLMLWSC